MLDELRRLRALQLAQAEALAGADLQRLSELDGERRLLQSRIAGAPAPPAGSADLAEARALARLLTRDQGALVHGASAARDALRHEIGALGVGRSALASYRPPAAGRSLYLDSSR